MLKGFFFITVGPCRLALGIQEKGENSLIIMVTTWKQKKSCKNKKFLSAESIEYFGQKKKKERVDWFTKTDYWNSYDTWGFKPSVT